MAHPLFDNLGPIARRCAEASHCLVGLDYDGTLTPLVDAPSLAVLDSATRSVLRKVAARRATSVAVVSGRQLEDVRKRVEIAGLIYAGNHGLEIAGIGSDFVEPTALMNRGMLARVGRVLVECLAPVGGVLVEDKGLTISVHFRKVAGAARDWVAGKVHEVVADCPESFRVFLGNEVLEIRPALDWHKGSALAWIANRLATPGLVTIYIGDDRTDEDVFQFLQEAITIKVGDGDLTAAEFQVEGPPDVARFLAWLADGNKEGLRS